MNDLLDARPCWAYPDVVHLFDSYAPYDRTFTAEDVLDFHRDHPNNLSLPDAAWVVSTVFLTRTEQITLTHAMVDLVKPYLTPEILALWEAKKLAPTETDEETLWELQSGFVKDSAQKRAAQVVKWASLSNALDAGVAPEAVLKAVRDVLCLPTA